MIDWSPEKNEWLKVHRGVCFEQVLVLFERGEVADILEHPDHEKYRGQKIAVVVIDDYAYLVPYVADGESIFLKTMIPSRKATAKYGKCKEKDK